MGKQRKQASTTPWADELDAFERAIAGAFLFGIPLLYTMEMWWRGDYTSPARMLVGLALTYCALLGINLLVGFRSHHDSSFARDLTDSAEALAIGLLVAALSLLLIRRISLDHGFEALLGRIVLEAIPFSLGVGIANGFLGATEEQPDTKHAAHDQQDGAKHAAAKPDSLWHGTLVDAGATALGATIIAFSIAPTDEVPMISSALTPAWLLGLLLASLVVSYVIVFEANFHSQEQRRAQQGVFQTPLSETVASYMISLLVALVMLWFFQSLRTTDPWQQWVTYTIVLGFPATVGGAAGRLAL